MTVGDGAVESTEGAIGGDGLGGEAVEGVVGVVDGAGGGRR